MLPLIFTNSILILSIFFQESRQNSPTLPNHDSRIEYHEDESQHFVYSSSTKLWGNMGGTIIHKADIILHCLGKDTEKQYNTEAFKYLVEVSNLQIEEKKEREDVKERKKRGIGQVFSKAWTKVKQFFNRMFGRNRREPEANHEREGENINTREEMIPKEEEENFNVAELVSVYSTPFQFVQLANGSIPDIRFSEEETDGRIKNFKRHLVDVFATQMNFNQREKSVLETSVMGEHTSNYNVNLDGNKASLTAAALTSSESEEDVVVVEKLVTEDDILKLAPSEGNVALNDKEKLQLRMHQKQIFQKGHMVQSSGYSSVMLLKNNNENSFRKKREAEDDVTAYFYAHSSHQMKLQKRHKRSAETSARLKEHINTYNFNSASRFAELEDNRAKAKLQNLQKSIQNATTFVYDLLDDWFEQDYDEKLQLMLELIEREVALKLDSEPESFSVAVRKIFTKEKIHRKCQGNFSKCKDFLQLLALTGGPEAEQVLLSFFNQRTSMSKISLQNIADIVSDTSSPSVAFIASLTEILEMDHLHEDVRNTLILSLGHLGSRYDEETKQKISSVLVKYIGDKESQCSSDSSMIDLLEAVGNLGCKETISHVFEVSHKCSDDASIQIACVNALRKFMHLSRVQKWLHAKSTEGDCEITRAIVGALAEIAKEQELDPGIKEWPRYYFNDLDYHFWNQLQNNSFCANEEIILYFKSKKAPLAKEIARNYYVLVEESNENDDGSRKKRAIWDNLNCEEWTEDNKYRPIQDREEFASDRAIYNKRKSCLAYRRLGLKRANAEIYAGMFAGVKEPSTPPKYKLFTKFVAGLNFLDHELEIGSFYFYHQSGKTKAYARIMGRTRQEFTYDACTPGDLRYRPLKHIPLYLFSIGSVQLSLGIHLSSQLALNTTCPQQEFEIYKLEPFAKVRVGGEAIGTLPFIQGGINLGGNFNYKLQFTFTPSPDMCLKGDHGYDPMNVSFETYYQLWNSAKNDWGKIRTWTPGFLSWRISRGAYRPWFADTCIAPHSSNRTVKPYIERELE